NASWIVVTGGGSGTGNGSVSLSIAENPSTTSRTGTVTIAGQTFTVQQSAAPCTYSLSSTAASVGNGGGTAGVNVVGASNCSWNATSNASWIVVTGGGSGTGNGSVSLSIAENPSTTSRTGTVTIAGQTFTVQQSAAPCTYSSSSTSASVGNGGGTAGVNIASASNCSWTATSNASWITVTGGASGTGNGSVSLSIAENPSTTSRTGTVTIAGQTFTVQQSAAPCTYSLSSTAASVGNGGGTAGVNVVGASNCSWNATSNASWITVTGGASGTGNSAVSLSIAENPSTTSRTGTVTIAGQTFTVQQAPAPVPAPVPVPCGYSLNTSNFSLNYQGGSAQVQVSTGATCSWSAVSQASWITVSAPDSSAGSGTVSIQVQANTSTSARTGTLLVAGQSVSVTQAGQPAIPVLSLSPSQVVLSSREGSVSAVSTSVSVQTTVTGAPFTVGNVLPPWLKVTASSGATPSTLIVSANPSGLAPGSYTATVSVLSTGTANPSSQLGVTFNVESDIVIRSSPRSLSFSASSGSTLPMSQYLRVKVSGSSTPVRAFVEGGNWISATAELVRNSWVVQTSINPSGLKPGIYDANVGVACISASCQSMLIPVRLQVNANSRADGVQLAGDPVQIASGGIVNAASFQQGTTEGSWMSIFGSGFTEKAREWTLADFDGARFPRSLDGVTVKVDGKIAPIHFVGPNQINFQTPAGVSKGWVLVELTTPHGTDQAYTYSSKENPGFFQIHADGQVAALFADGRAVGRLPENPAAGAKWTPAKAGDTIAIFGTGFGPTDPGVEPGVIYSGAAQLIAKGALHVFIGGVEAKVEFAGQSGGGLNQLNVVVPPLPRGDHEILAIVDGVPTQFAGRLAVD
ncbi:MAG: hypothetical protein IT170_16380, partial [Bryobacterales bacterium]|nr:hypothetical protein [Bryobacterales bacterium]